MTCRFLKNKERFLTKSTAMLHKR